MIKFGTAFKIPKDFYDICVADGANALLIIYSHSTQKIRIMPVKASAILKISITIGHLSPSFMSTMTKLFADLRIVMLYNTGICFTEASCSYEGFLALDEKLLSHKEDLIKKITSLESVKSVETEEIRSI